MTRRQELDPITVLMPCKSQKKEFFFDAVGSIVRQTSPWWRLLIITDPDTPPEIEQWAVTFADPRIRVRMCPQTGFARALNYGLRTASTQFVSILLSDDRYTARAIAALMAYRQRYPAADFFHSARRHIGEGGERWGGILPSRREFQLRDFATRGSPVKHLLCWRRAKSIEIGGMDESLSMHGCDDYDFPWRMAEAGARFEAVRACLYEYRLHHAHDRLTTSVPLASQIATLRAIFSRHNIAPLEADRFVERAARGYLIPEFLDQIDRQRGARTFVRCFRETRAENSAVTYRLYVVPGAAADVPPSEAHSDSRRSSRFLLYALDSPPADQEGTPAIQANAALENSIIRCGAIHFGDAVNQTAPALASQLLKGIVAHAAENQFDAVYWPAESAALGDPDSYREVCDAAAKALGAERVGDCWRISWVRDAPRLTALNRWERRFEVDVWPKMVCVLHEQSPVSGTVAACRWEAVSATSAQEPWLDEGIVKIPVHGELPHLQRTELHALMAAREFVVLRLNCAPEYTGILADLSRNVTLISPGEVAHRVALGHSRWFEGLE